MIWYEVEKSLRNLIKDSGKISTSYAFAVWVDEIGDMMELALPAKSDIKNRYYDLKTAVEKKSGDLSDDQLKEGINKCIQLLNAVIRVGKLSYHDKDEADDIWKEFERIFIKRYIKSIWFYVPFGILVGAIIFAMFGVIQIQNYRADIRDVAEKAIGRAMKRIDKTTGDVTEDIINHKNQAIKNLDKIADTEKFTIQINTEKKRINNAYLEMNNSLDKQTSANKTFVEKINQDRAELQEDLTKNIRKQVEEFAGDIKGRVNEAYFSVVKETVNKDKEEIKKEIKSLQTDTNRANNTLEKSVKIAEFFQNKLEGKVNKIDNSLIHEIVLRLKAEYWIWGVIIVLLIASLVFSVFAWKKAAHP